jgi:CBS domain-containing protein
MYVNEVMTTQLLTCHPDSSLDEVARMMWEGNCGAIPVVADNKPLGIVTDRDIAMAAMLNHRPLWDIPASTVIQGQNLCCCNQQDSIDSCLKKMEQQEVRRVLVTDDVGTLSGILSMGDALAFTASGNGPAKKTDRVDADNVLGMLKKVSAHHQFDSAPSLRVDQQSKRPQSAVLQ